MHIKKRSFFKDQAGDHVWFNGWVNRLENTNNRKYGRRTIKTAIGKTHVWMLNEDDRSLEALVIFPGARTTSLFWDLDRNLDNLEARFRIFLVETNGLPNLSDGDTPDIKSLDYGHWASEVLSALAIDSCFIAGASFGGLICMKLAIVAPEKIKSVFLLNPGCLQPFSLSFKNLYYNILPIISPTAANVSKFLNAAVLSKPGHTLSSDAEKLLVEYEVFALTRYHDRTQKPYDMGDELLKVKTPTYLLVGDKDLLFPYTKSIDTARKKISSLKDIIVFPNVGHGIETYSKALKAIGSTMLKRIAT